jgi:hypothetical protein
VKISYVVHVGTATHDSLAQFVVDAPTLLRVQLPGDPSEWFVLSASQHRSVATWAKFHGFTAPGDSTPPLTLTARGLIDIVPYWAGIVPHGDTMIVDTGADSVVAGADTVIHVEGSTGLTVGVRPFPADTSAAALATRLSGLIDRVCALGWIQSNGEFCRSLEAKAKPETGPLNAMLHELSAQRGKRVNEAAYVLLSQNASFLLLRL